MYILLKFIIRFFDCFPGLAPLSVFVDFGLGNEYPGDGAERFIRGTDVMRSFQAAVGDIIGREES